MPTGILLASRLHPGQWTLRAFVALMYAIMLCPLVFVVWLSFFKDAILYFPPSGYTLSWYLHAWENQAFVNGFIVSLQVASLSAVIGVGHLGCPDYFVVCGVQPPVTDVLHDGV